MTRVTILVSHLLGTGHLTRALALAAACRSTGFEVLLISGGMPVSHLDGTGVDLLQLPPVRSEDFRFRSLIDQAGEPVSEALLEERGRLIIGALRANPPDVLVTELFPFGRRLLRAEFETALATAKTIPRAPLILSSVRDILEPPSRPEKAAEAQDRLTKYYDGVLVHSDPRLVTLDANWPVSPELAKILHYTGYIAPPEKPPDTASRAGAGEILVTAGGGPLGRKLFAMAVRAARHSDMPRRWRLLVGGVDAADLCAELNEAADDAPVVAEPVRRDYRAMLTRCAVAVGRCGYNTALDWLCAGVPGVFVPFADAAQTEQTQRAQILRRRFGYGVVAENDMTPAALVAATENALRRGRIDAGDLDIGGAAASARAISQMLASRG